MSRYQRETNYLPFSKIMRLLVWFAALTIKNERVANFGNAFLELLHILDVHV